MLKLKLWNRKSKVLQQSKFSAEICGYIIMVYLTTISRHSQQIGWLWGRELQVLPCPIKWGVENLRVGIMPCSLHVNSTYNISIQEHSSCGRLYPVDINGFLILFIIPTFNLWHHKMYISYTVCMTGKAWRYHGSQKT